MSIFTVTLRTAIDTSSRKDPEDKDLKAQSSRGAFVGTHRQLVLSSLLW